MPLDDAFGAKGLKKKFGFLCSGQDNCAFF
jgi:hypothetical protein